jgi:hypothetical protein
LTCGCGHVRIAARPSSPDRDRSRPGAVGPGLCHARWKLNRDPGTPGPSRKRCDPGEGLGFDSSCFRCSPAVSPGSPSVRPGASAHALNADGHAGQLPHVAALHGNGQRLEHSGRRVVCAVNHGAHLWGVLVKSGRVGLHFAELGLHCGQLIARSTQIQLRGCGARAASEDDDGQGKCSEACHALSVSPEGVQFAGGQT